MNEDARRAVVVAFLLLLVAVAAWPQNQPRVLALDPLTPQERAVASSVARADARIRQALGSARSRQIYVDFISVKRIRETDPQKDLPSHRYADVLFYRYDRDLGVRALVDLEGRAVVDVVQVNGQSVPINVEEIQEAARLALADPRVVRLFGGRVPAFEVSTRPPTREELNTNRIEGLRTVSSLPNDACFRRRCIVLFFLVNNRYVHMNRVVVDLTSQTVQVLGGGR